MKNLYVNKTPSRRAISNRLQKHVSSAYAQGWFITITFAVCWLIYSTWHGGRLVIYFIPALAVVYAVARGAKTKSLKYDPVSAKALALYLTAFFLALFTNFRISALAPRDFVLISSSLVVFLVSTRISGRMVGVLYATCILNLFLTAFGLTSRSAMLGSGLSDMFDFVDSKGLVESALAFPFGLFCLYFIVRRKYTAALITGFFLVISFKRIAFGALFIGWGVWWFLSAKSLGSLYTKRAITYATILAYISVVIAVAFFIEDIALFVIELFKLNVSANYLLQGRVYIHRMLIRAILDSDLPKMLFGHGAGTIDLLSGSLDVSFENPHNDVLKLMYDYGVIGMALYFAAMWKFLARHPFGIAVFAYNAALMISDNTIIYFYHQFIAIFLIIAWETSKEANMLKKDLSLSPPRAARKDHLFPPGVNV